MEAVRSLGSVCFNTFISDLEGSLGKLDLFGYHTCQYSSEVHVLEEGQTAEDTVF